MAAPLGAKPRREDAPAWRAAMRDLYRGAAAAALIGLFVNTLYLSLPLYQSQIFNRVIGSGSFDTLVALTAIVVVLLGFQGLLDYLRSRIFAILAARLGHTLGRPAFEAAVETSLSQGTASAAGAIRDLTDLRAFVSGGAMALPLDLLFTPILIAVLFLLHPAYGLIGLAGAAVLTGAALATEMLARRPVGQATLAAGDVQAETAAAFRATEVIAGMGMLPAIAARWRRAQRRSLESIERGRGRAKALSALARALRLGIQIAVIFAGAALVIDQQVTPGTLLAATVIMSRMLFPFEHLIDGWRQWVDAFAAGHRLREVLARGASGRSTTPAPIAHGRLVVDRLSYIPPGQDTPVLRNVSFRIDPGELVGVIGPSGAGKSTLARLVIGLWPATAGGVFLDGQSTYLHERASFGAAVGYLPQEPQLLDGSVRDNIARFGAARMEEVIAAARIAGVHELIGRLPRGYETRLSDAGARLSGGQRQRIALARALYGGPRLLVLDEPNSSLDSDGEAALVEAIAAARAGGAAVLVIAQRMSILGRADRLIVLREGAVAQAGDRAEVMAGLAPKPRAVAGGRA